jgi:hypothetical protein
MGHILFAEIKLFKKFMTNAFLLIVLISVCIVVSCRKSEEGPDIQWEKTYGGEKQDLGNCVQQTTDGGYIIVGYTESFGAQFQDIYIIRTDANGNILWTKMYGGDRQEWGNSISQTTDGGYIVFGHTSSFGSGGGDFYLLRTDANGDTLWTKTYGGASSEFGTSAQPTFDGGYILTGMTSSYGAGGKDVWLVKTNANGDTSWTKTYGGANDEGSYSVQQTDDGGYIIGGYTKSYGSGREDIYAIKTDANGNVTWTKTYGGADQEWGSISQISDGGYIIRGWTNSFSSQDENNGDIYLVKADENGDTIWTAVFGGDSSEFSSDVTETFDGCFVVVGHTSSFGAGADDVYLIKVDTDGNLLWSKTYGGAAYDWGSSLQETSDGGYIITGHTYSFGEGSRDVYLIKTVPDVE